MKFTRRSFLGIGAASAAFTVLGVTACQQPAPAPTAAPTAKPTEAPKPAAAATTAPAPAAATTAPAPTAAPAAKPTEAPAAKPAAKAAAGTVRWQNRSDDVTLKAETEFIQQNFEKQNPNIKVSIEPAPDGRDEKLITAMVGGNAPDVFESWSDNVTQFADRGQVLDVESLVKRDFTADDLKDFYAWQWRDFILPSQIRFGMPKYVNVMVIWYNKDMFDKAGVKYPDNTWTHDTYAEAAKKLNVVKDNKVEVFGLQYPVWSWDRYWYKVDAWGGAVRDPSDDTKATFDSPEALAAFEWSRKLMWDDKAMAQRLLLMGTATSYDPRALFAAGRFAMAEDGFYPFTMARAIQGKIKWGWAHTPPGPKGRKVLGTTDGYCIWKGSKVQDAAWELLKYQSGKEFQMARNKLSGALPVRFSALADWKQTVIKAYPELADVNLDVGPQAMEMGYAGNRQFFKKDAEARQIVVPALEKVFVSGNTPVTYFKEIADQVTKKMRA